MPLRLKSRGAVQGFHEADTGADNAPPVAFTIPFHVLLAHAAQHGLVLKQADIKTANKYYVHARFLETSKPTRDTPCSSAKFRMLYGTKYKFWRLKVWWLYGFKSFPSIMELHTTRVSKVEFAQNT